MKDGKRLGGNYPALFGEREVMMEMEKDRVVENTDEFIDTRMNKIKVQESSAAMEHCVWVFIKNDGRIGEDFKGDMSLHLNREQADLLIANIKRCFE